MTILGKNKKWWFAISIGLTVLGIIALAIWKLQIGIDFTGGSLLEVRKGSSITEVEQVKFKEELVTLGISHLTVQEAGEDGLLVKAGHIDQEKYEKVKQALPKYGLTESRFENVGPTVGRDLTQKAIIAVIIASAAIIFYIAYSFRGVPKPASSWRFGITAVIALIHDVFITVGVFALLGHFFGYEVDALFITALLTIMGFSVHDTIVVFDRLRENMRLSPISTPAEFESVANNSLAQTLNRSLNTSLTVIFVLLSMASLGGPTIRPFVVALLVGITIGTFSSIFTATPLLVAWQSFAMRRQS